MAVLSVVWVVVKPGRKKGISGGVAEPLDEKDGQEYTIFLLEYDSVSVFHLCHSGNEYNI